MSPTVEISYALHPPATAKSPEGLNQNTKHEFPVAEGQESSELYYEGLRVALSKAKVVLGKELTAWRDAVGDLEKDKDGGKWNHDEEEEEEEEADEENTDGSGDNNTST